MSKPQDKKHGSPPARTISTTTKALKAVKALVFLVLAGVASAVSQLNLSPVYGSIPASLYHQRVMTGVSLLTFMINNSLKTHLPGNVSQYLSIIAYWIPTVQFYLFRLSSTLGPVYGPVITELLTYYPLLLLAIHSSSLLLQALDFSSWNPTLAEMLPAIGSYSVVSVVSKIASLVLPNFMGTHGLLSRTRLQLIVASVYAALSSTGPAVLLCLPAMLHTIRVNTHYNSEQAVATLNTTLSNYNYSILARQESSTGYISVLESWNDQFRVLRCDHSLLGGNWLVTPERIAHGQMMPETIYSVFTMLEAVRLVEVPDDRPDSEKSALVIGLGIGTAPTALIGHGINTTIVELDPVVHYYATEYFDLPKNHIAAIQDAVTFVDEVSEYAPESYDYVIHDVFTGGAEPVSLFTLEFLLGLKKVSKKNGVVAINYAGDLSLPSTQTVLNTIHHVFPVCRIYRDSPAMKTDENEPKTADFINMIVFCLNSDGTTSKQSRLKFRAPIEADFAGSLARRHNLFPKPELEIKYKYHTPDSAEEHVQTKTLLTRDTMGRFAEIQRESALSHWRIMRTVLPDGVWENW